MLPELWFQNGCGISMMIRSLERSALSGSSALVVSSLIRATLGFCWV